MVKKVDPSNTKGIMESLGNTEIGKSVKSTLGKMVELSDRWPVITGIALLIIGAGLLSLNFIPGLGSMGMMGMVAGGGAMGIGVFILFNRLNTAILNAEKKRGRPYPLMNGVRKILRVALPILVPLAFAGAAAALMSGGPTSSTFYIGAILSGATILLIGKLTIPAFCNRRRKAIDHSTKPKADGKPHNRPQKGKGSPASTAKSPTKQTVKKTPAKKKVPNASTKKV